MLLTVTLVLEVATNPSCFLFGEPFVRHFDFNCDMQISQLRRYVMDRHALTPQHNHLKSASSGIQQQVAVQYLQRFGDCFLADFGHVTIQVLYLVLKSKQSLSQRHVNCGVQVVFVPHES